MHSGGILKYILMIPAVILCIVFVLWPIVDLVWLSVHKTNFISTKFVGLQNYEIVFQSPEFWQSMGNSGLYILIITTMQVSIAVFFSLSVTGMSKRWIDATRIIAYLPALTAGVIIAMVWRWIFHQDGLANWVIGLVGVAPVQWFAGATAVPIISMIVVASGFGGYVIMTLASIQSINKELFDAARIDGASEWQIKTRIILPLLRPTISMMVMLTAISAPQIIETIMMLAPYDHASSMAFKVYQEAFQNGRHGVAAAMAILMTVALVIMALVKNKVVKDEI